MSCLFFQIAARDREGLLRYIINVVTGTLAHWNATNNAVVSELWSEVGTLDASTGETLRKFVEYAYLVVAETIGPSGDLKLYRKSTDLKKLERGHFRDAYAVILSYFIFLFPAQSEPHSSNLAAALSQLLEGQDYLDTVDAMAEGLRFQTEARDLSKLGFEVARLFSQAVSPLGLEANPLFSYVFTTTLLAAYKSAVEEIQA